MNVHLKRLLVGSKYIAIGILILSIILLFIVFIVLSCKSTPVAVVVMLLVMAYLIGYECEVDKEDMED